MICFCPNSIRANECTALIVGCIPAISQVFRGIGGSSHNPADSNPYEQRQANTSAGNPASWPGRGRKSHLSASAPAAFSSEENLFDDGRSKTEIVSTTLKNLSSSKSFIVLTVILDRRSLTTKSSLATWAAVEHERRNGQ